MAKSYVANELGHTSYPKWVDTNEVEFKTQEGKEVYKRVLVNSPEEEEKATSGNKKAGKASGQNVDPNKQNNPQNMPQNSAQPGQPQNPNVAPGWSGNN